MERLRTVMRANALFSALSGALLLFGAGTLDRALGLEEWFLAVVGGALLGYGGLLWLLASRPDAAAGARFATAMDVAWVCGAAVILIGFPTVMAATGRVALSTVSLVVAGFAAAQVLCRPRGQRGRATVLERSVSSRPWTKHLRSAASRRKTLS